MAAELRHAARQNESRFAVRRLDVGGAAQDLATGLRDFLTAVDVAAEWLDREDPARNGAAQLRIVEIRGGVAAEVWSYPPDPRPSASQELVQLYGFNPAAWRPR